MYYFHLLNSFYLEKITFYFNGNDENFFQFDAERVSKKTGLPNHDKKIGPYDVSGSENRAFDSWLSNTYLYYYVCKVYDWIISILCRFRQQVDDCCLTPRDQIVGYIMARTKYIQWNGDDVSFVLDQHALVWPDRGSHPQTITSRWARQQLNHWSCSLNSDTLFIFQYYITDKCLLVKCTSVLLVFIVPLNNDILLICLVLYNRQMVTCKMYDWIISVHCRF